MFLQEANEVAMQDLVDVFGGISPLLKKFSHPLQGGNGLDILGRLLGPKAPVKIRTDPHVIGIPGQLTDVIGMIEQALKIQPGSPGGGDSPLPSRDHHPGIEGSPDHRSPLNQTRDLFVRDLPRIVTEGATVRVTGPHRSPVEVECIVKGPVRKVRLGMS